MWGMRGDVQGVAEQVGRQEVAGRGAAAGCGAGTQLLGEGEKTTEEEAGWAACWLGRPARPLGCTGLQVSPGRFSISFSFLFF